MARYFRPPKPRAPTTKPKNAADPKYIDYAYSRGYYNGWFSRKKSGPPFYVKARAEAYLMGADDGQSDREDWDNRATSSNK